MKKIWQYIAPGGAPFWLCNGLVIVYSLSVQWIDDHGFPAKKLIEADAALLTSVIMGILLVFRTNSAYDRWWEGRKLWGSLVNELRNFSIKAREYANLDERESAALAALMIGFAHGLKDHLRGIENMSLIPQTSRDEKQNVSHLPLAISQLIYRSLHQWRIDGRVTEIEMLQLDRHARALMDICGGCERIRKSPIAGSYKFILWLGMTLYFVILPWLLVPTVDNITVYMVAVGAYFVLSLEFLAEEVEEPFGRQANDLPLDDICKTIEESMADVLHYRAQQASPNLDATAKLPRHEGTEPAGV
ncbi:MAG: bestrophin family ion channel [Candidatus Melainabacteria bacterium]|nr:bestrophin family ion channel [Candidatus Melainabacteria bacterium]